MRTPLLVLAATVLMALALPAHGDEWAFPAASQPGYAPNPTISFKVGAMAPDSGSSGFAGGVELSLDNPLIQTGYGKIRDQFSYNRFDSSGLKIETLEYNPHYMVPIGERVWVGGGPGIGYMFTDSVSGPSPDLWTAQLGVSASTVIDHLQIGLEARWQWTEDQRVGNANGADNWLTMLKFGYAY